jgi:hypothetical protein
MQKTWKEKDFDLLNWHDSSVHSFSIQEGENGTGTLMLDIDYITRWPLQDAGPPPTFSVAPANLIFYEVSDLAISINYAASSAGITPFTIQQIVRQQKKYPNGYSSYRWVIEINWPAGSIEFVAKEFSMTLTADSIETTSQTLTREQRR